MSPHDPRLRPPPAALIAALVLAASSLVACGDDDAPNSGAQRDTDTTQTTEREEGRDAQAERETRAIAEDLKALQRDVARSGRKLVEGDAQEQDAAKRELRAQARRARELAERTERDVAEDAQGRAELREAAEQTERGVARLRRVAEDSTEEGLRRANAELEQAERSLRSFAESLRDDAPEDEVRRALDDLRERVPDIPMP